MKRQWDAVILGGGFAGLACAKRLEKLWGPDCARRVLLVNAENYFVFQPFLPEVIGASIEPRHVTNPIRFVLRRCTLMRAQVKRIHLKERRVEFDSTDGPYLDHIEARHVILALGSSTNLRAVPGMMEHALFLKTLADALSLREHIVRRLEEASLESHAHSRKHLLHFVVVGGGYSGVETAGEILDLLHDARRFYPMLDLGEFQVTLVHSGSHVLPELGEKLGRFTQKTLESRGMVVMVNQRVTSVSRDYLRLKDGTRLDTHNVICTIGNAPNPVLADLEAEYERGKLLTDEYLRVKGYEDVWAIGDGASNPDGYGGRCPPTAQCATPLGEQVARNIDAALANQPLDPFRFKMLGQMATIGHHKGVCSIFGVQFSGILAWWVTRTVHLLKLPGIDRKLRVMIDWTFELFFPPDLNYWDLRKTQKLARVHVEPGDLVFRQGDQGQAFYVVEEGILEVIRCDANGNVLWKDELVRGDHFGEGSLLYGLERRVTVTAKTEATLLVFASKDFKLFVDLFQSLREMLSSTATRGPLEEFLNPATWSEELLESPVTDHMNTSPVSMAGAATIAEAVQQLAERRQHMLLVIDENGKLTGLLTKTDLFRCTVNRQPLSETLNNIGSQDVTSVQSTQSIRDALRVLYMKAVKQVPILDDTGRPVGLLSYLDVVLARAQRVQKTSHTTLQDS
ncbi:MAG: nucleotide-disulfide oxidoreductase [Nitrospirales bacterium]|nr:MAG: nucleotide-disulfide oxidoreductase [Nitrospirales bacterium]